MSLLTLRAIGIRCCFVFGVFALLLSSPTMEGNTITVTIYESFGSAELSTFGDEFSGRVGTLQIDPRTAPYDFSVKLPEWQPFGLTEFAAVFEGVFYTPVFGYYNQAFGIGGGWFDTQGWFQVRFHQALIDGEPSDQGGTETEFGGYMYFRLLYQTDRDPTTSTDFYWWLPTAWGGDPRVESREDAIVYVVPDVHSTAIVAGLALLGIASLRRSRRLD